jgi:microcin C transport system substrate-binding protein
MPDAASVLRVIRIGGGKDLPVSRGLYNFDSLTVNFYGDTDVARQLLQAGAFDYNREFSSSGYVVGYDSPALRDGRLQQSILAPEKPTAAQGFVFNLQNPAFKDRRVRQAISLLWDFEWTNKQMMRGFYVRQNSYWPKSEMAATALPDAEELKILEPLRGQIPDEVFTEVYQAPKTDGSGYIRDKQLQALKLLAEAGWTPQHNRLVNADWRTAGVHLSSTVRAASTACCCRSNAPWRRSVSR